jgi:opacity protein-like surface antigen
MKTIQISAAALLLTTTLTLAGGDIAPLEPEVNTPDVIESSLGMEGLYAGLGYTYMAMDNAGIQGDVSGNGITLLAGYNFNEYIGVEGRFSQTLDDLSVDYGPDDGDLSNIALYIKPQYVIADTFTLYGLLGYGQVTFDNGLSDQSEEGFQYGAGISIMATENIGLYVDYTRLYDDDNFDAVIHKDITVDALNIGLTYNF